MTTMTTTASHLAVGTTIDRLINAMTALPRMMTTSNQRSLQSHLSVQTTALHLALGARVGRLGICDDDFASNEDDVEPFIDRYRFTLKSKRRRQGADDDLTYLASFVGR